MKVRNNRLYPYPILYSNSNDYINNKFNTECELEYDQDNAMVLLNVEISDSKMLELIKDGIVGIYCHIECSSTKYREIFEIKTMERDTIVIPLAKLNDSVEILTVLVAKKNIENYINDNLNELYKGEKLDIIQYSTLGYTDTEEFIINKRIDGNGQIPSIFNIIKSETEKTITTDTTGDQINIYLPRESFDIYESCRGKYKRLKQLMVIVPVLIDVIQEIKNDTEEFSSKGWYPILEKAFINKGYNDAFNDENFKNKSALELSQEVLGDIINDSFKEFSETLDKEDIL